MCERSTRDPRLELLYSRPTFTALLAYQDRRNRGSNPSDNLDLEFDQPKDVERQQQTVQHEDRHQPGISAIGDERDVAADRDQAQRQHRLHAESQKDCAGGQIAERVGQKRVYRVSSPAP